MTPAEAKVPLATALRALRDDLADQAPPAMLWPNIQAAIQSSAARSVQRTVPRAMAAPRAAQLLRWKARVPWPAWAGAAGCAAVMLLSLLLLMRPPTPATAPAGREARLAPGPVRGGQVAAADEGWMPAAHFVPLIGPEQLRSLAGADGPAPAGRGRGSGSGRAADAAAQAWVLTAELPYQRLASFGLPYDPGRAGELLRAELLVAGNGEVLAVRLLF